MRNEIKYLALKKIKVNPWNPNKMEVNAFNRLKKEISMTDFITAIQVVPLDDGMYRIIGGEHRYRVAAELGYEEIPAVILSDVRFNSEDLQKFLTVRLNMLHGELDPDKFRVLYEEMADKYGEDSLQDLFGYTDEHKWDMITKQIKKGLHDAGFDKKDVDKIIDNIDDKSIENLSVILGEIFAKGGDILKKNGIMKMDYEGTDMIFIDVDRTLFKDFSEFDLECEPADTDNQINKLFNHTLEIIERSNV